MSNDDFDSAQLADVVRNLYPAPVARPFARMAAAEEHDLTQSGERLCEALLRYLALVALRGAFATDRNGAAELMRRFAQPGTKGRWLERLRDALALWPDEAAIAMLGPSDAGGRSFAQSRAHEALARAVEKRKLVKYGDAPAEHLCAALRAALIEVFGLREHRLLVPRKIVETRSGCLVYRATLYRGQGDVFGAITLETEAELELGHPYLGRRGSRELLPLWPLFLEADARGQRQLFIVDAIHATRVEAVSLLSGEALDDAHAREVHQALTALAAGLASQPDWLRPSKLTTDDELPAGLSRRTPGDLLSERYRIVDFIASGASADVYIARDEHDGQREVALKVLPFEIARDAQSLARLAQEIVVAQSAKHDNVVAYLDQGRDRGDAFVVLELADGWTVGDRRARDLGAYVRLLEEAGSALLDDAQARRLVDDLARGLGALHAAGFVHRDISPANVLLFAERGNGRQRAKIADFGITRSTDALTISAGFRVGTPRYMAPERLDPKQPAPASAASDMYSLGCVLYEALAGRAPFEATSDAAIEQLHRHAKPAPLAELRPDVSPALVALVHRALAKRPENRPRDCAELLGMLADPTPATLAEDDLQPTASSDGAVTAQRRRSPALWLAPLAALASIAGVAALLLPRTPDAAELAGRIVEVVCHDRSREEVRALFSDLIHAIDAQRAQLAAQPDGSKLRTPLVTEIGTLLAGSADLRCVLEGFATLISSRLHPEFDSSESLWRLIVNLAGRSATAPDVVVALDELSRASLAIEPIDATARFVSAVHSLSLTPRFLATEHRPDADPLIVLDLRQIVERIDTVLRDQTPRVRHDFDALRILALARLIGIDPIAAGARAPLVTEMRNFLSQDYADRTRSNLELTLLANEVKNEWDAFEFWRDKVQRALQELIQK